MNLKISMVLNKSLDLPINYQHVLQSIIYKNMQDDGGTSDFYHDDGYRMGARKFKLFCFSFLQGNYSVNGKRITFYDEASFEVRSPEVRLIRSIADHMERQGIIFGSNQPVRAVTELSNPLMESDSIDIKMMSPVTVYGTSKESGKTIYYSPADPMFSKAVEENFRRKYMAYYGVAPNSMIHIEPVQVDRRDKRVTCYKDFYINGWMGTYRLTGKRQYLDFAYQTGIGAKNAQGFGLFEQVKWAKSN